MTLSGPMKTARVLLRLTPEEKARLEELAAEQHITLSHAMREGAKLYLAELTEARRIRGGTAASSVTAFGGRNGAQPS